MRVFDRRQAAVDLGDVGVGFGLCQCAVQRGAVDLALQVAAVAPGGAAVGFQATP